MILHSLLHFIIEIIRIWNPEISFHFWVSSSPAGLGFGPQIFGSENCRWLSGSWERGRMSGAGSGMSQGGLENMFFSIESWKWRLRTFEKMAFWKKKASRSRILNSTMGIFRGALISLTNHDSIGNWVAFASSGQGFLDTIQEIKKKLKSWEKAPSKGIRKNLVDFVYCLKFYMPWNFKVGYFRGI